MARPERALDSTDALTGTPSAARLAMSGRKNVNMIFGDPEMASIVQNTDLWQFYAKFWVCLSKINRFPNVASRLRRGCAGRWLGVLCGYGASAKKSCWA
jgi:hypothetical protein